MSKIKLTARYVESAKATGGKRLEVFDQDVKGLILRVTPAGRKTWVFRYRASDGTQRRHALGVFIDGYVPPTPPVEQAGEPKKADDEDNSKETHLDLNEARNQARQLRNEIGKGLDPSAKRESAISKAQAEPMKTFSDLWEVYRLASATGEWRPRNKAKRAATLAEEARLWEKHIKPDLGEKALEAVTAELVRKVLRGLVADGKGITSNRCRSLIRQMFNFAIAEERIEVNPVSKVKALAEEKPRSRVLSDQELKAVWQALNDPTGLMVPASKPGGEPEELQIGEPVRLALKLLILTLKRRAEVAGMELAELDLEQAGWSIPGERTKSGRADFVLLSPMASELIRRAVDIRETKEGEKPSPVVFPSRTNKAQGVTPSALSHALRKLRLALGLKRLSPHDLRRTASTIMSSERLRVSMFLVGRLLNHATERGGAAAVTMNVYALHEYAAEKRAALNAWASLLSEIVGDSVPSNVVQMARA